MRRARIVRGGLAVGLAAAAVAVALPATGSHAAATVTVTTTADGDDGSCTQQKCTLRDAVTYSPTETVILVPAGTYSVATSLTPNPVNLSIVGQGRGATVIDGGNAVTVLDVTGGTLSVVGVTITHGRDPSSGGGVRVEAGATLGLSQSRVTGNVGVSSGGGIYSQGGNVAVTMSTIDGNQAMRGGGAGIDAEPASSTEPGSLDIVNSTITGNTANSAGAAILVNAPLSLLNTTIAGNGDSTTGHPSVDFGTGQAGGEIFNSIIAARAPNSACAGPVPATADASHDIVTDTTCGFPATAPGMKQVAFDALKLDALKDNLGPTPTMALLSGSPAIDAGDPNACQPTDQRNAPRNVGVCDIGAFEFGAVVPSTPTPTPTPRPTSTPPPVPIVPTPTPTPTPTPIPAPTFNRTFDALHSKGLVRIKLPGKKKYVLLEKGASIPKGTLIDTTKGRVTLVSADRKGKQQHAWFYEGIFKVLGQTKGRKPITLLNLAGPKPRCTTSKAKKSDGAASRKRRKQRHLWGNSKGRFRTTGQYSSATVRGTIWLTQDSCKGTLVRVRRGIVAVVDFTKHKTYLVKAGHSHLARPPR